MIVRILLVIFPILIIFSFFSCTNPTEPSLGTNLLQNPSFEINGNASTAGWIMDAPPEINFSNDVPPGGGKWSIYIDIYTFLPPTFLYDKCQVVKPLSGKHVYTFSFWGKFKTIPGEGILYTFKGDSIATAWHVRMRDTSWTKYSLTDTISSIQADSIMVKLYQGSGEVIIARSYFDLCSLTAR